MVSDSSGATVKLLAVVTTVATRDDAQRIATALVERRLAACVQISQIESVYAWQGALQQEREFRIVAKTVADRYHDVEQAIRELHDYDLPAIFALPVAAVFEPYAQWVAAGSVS